MIGNKPCVLVTGATGGMGQATVRKLAANGFHVYAADLNKSGLDAMAPHQSITPVFMDVADRISIEKAFHTVNAATERLAGIVNFAGIIRLGAMAEIPEEDLGLVININVMGTYRVNQVFLPLLNTVKKGRIINISSETGWQSGGPFNGAYAMSKHAIEAYSDSLRRELMFLGIHVVKIQPGPFKTEMVASMADNFDRALGFSRYFEKQLIRVKTLALKEQTKAHSPEIIASTVLKALTCNRPKAAYSVKADPGRSLLEVLPSSISDYIVKKVIGS